MKRFFDYISLILMILFLNYCGEPLPTELITDAGQQQQNDFTLEVISPNPGDIDYSNGYDSTGIVTTLTKDFYNLIVFNKVIDKYKKMDRFQDLAVAVFFDKNEPVNTPAGHLLGYRTRKIGKIYFNGTVAHTVPMTARYFYRHAPVNVDLGPMHMLRRGMMRMQPMPIADFNSMLDVKLLPDSDSLDALEGSLRVPKKLDPVLLIKGSREVGDLEILLNWENPEPDKKIEIIIGGIKMGNMGRMPLLRLKTKDDGELVIPKRILKPLPFDDFSRMIISVIRKSKKTSDTVINNSRTLITTQVIHNLIFDVP